MNESLKVKMAAHAESMQPMSPQPMLVGEDRWMPGLSKREFVASQIMSVLMGDITYATNFRELAQTACKATDALFLELENPSVPEK